ncbi:hypothetical protein EHQ12_14385 [Leptospira gomenensis]|uniref:Uncharacterized protein n=1 Tax=Leptospira gomenensis TaxID=2484974 RepID=A0A5F1YAH8_9LEPT|nr:hypothetical protein [Leptospira gomenensis]TGK33862.1 hypothetical protein EHQ17_10185 [Leptospira gomenensis]TGK36317.1 hypothetical protein EHQ12_14385 [Leptospira gomenensis]TGK52087.1 hypothetical protein EHQ07_00480 [Leptospira gomenensis]TGK59864.1 hypothetical protein EHQ13_11575 [Leptospira gomenensis]
MRLIGAFNIQSSLLISGISAAGLGVLISLAQVREPDPFAIPETSPYHKTEKNPTPTRQDAEKKNPSVRTFSAWTFRKPAVPSDELGSNSGIDEDREFSFLQPGLGGSRPFLPGRNTIHNTPDFLWSDSNQLWTGSKFFGGKQGNVQLISSILPAQPFADSAPTFKGRKSDPFGSGDRTGVNQSTLDALELSYTLVPGVEAILKTGNTLPYTSDHKEQGYSMAGFSFKPNEFISARIVSGSSFGNAGLSSNRVFSSATNPQTTNPDPNIGQNPILRNQAMGSGGGRVIEWQASIQPVKRISFQTSVFNKEKERGYYNPEAARFSMFIDLTKIVLNIRYSYTADPTVKNNGLYITPESDATTLGFTMLLDPAGRYSLFFGNNYYNLMSQRNTGINQVEEPLRSFSASFRGKTGFQNAIFFMNFRNNLSKGVIYTDVGPFRLPAYSQYYTEYFTSLGMELSF